MPVISRPVGITPGQKIGVPGSKTLVTETDSVKYEVISPTQLKAEAQKGAVMAEAQLESDVAMIKSINDDRTKFNDVVMAVATDATGKNPGRTPKDWREAMMRGKQSDQPSKSPKPTFGEMATLAYQPVFAPAGYGNTRITHVLVDS
jgi:hypothetical protein